MSADGFWVQQAVVLLARGFLRMVVSPLRLLRD
jgi:hypothetical protein